MNTTKQDEMVGTWPYDHKLTTATATKVREVGGEGGGEGELCTLKHAHTDKQKKNGHDERAGSAVMYTGEGLQLFSGMWSDCSN